MLFPCPHSPKPAAGPFHFFLHGGANDVEFFEDGQIKNRPLRRCCWFLLRDCDSFVVSFWTGRDRLLEVAVVVVVVVVVGGGVAESLKDFGTGFDEHEEVLDEVLGVVAVSGMFGRAVAGVVVGGS